MKKHIILTVLCLGLFVSCGGSSGGTDTPTPDPTPNTNPTTPIAVYPANNDLCINNSIAFNWNAATDAENDLVKYSIQIATDNGFVNIAHTFSNITQTTKTISLSKGTAYYWRVKATDNNQGESSYSSTHQFYTEGEPESNNAPFVPVLIAPTKNAVVSTTSVNLQWSCNDVDNDTLTYTVYFGTTNPPIAVKQDYSSETYNVSLKSSTSYYWKIDATDSKGAITKGQLWKFKTD
ncbi:MAG: hypothetical protein COB98_10590 [Flavobacteriaceae bacterium]|nr:MAG: hypothetical protein COB98_10590 [Flavobacteriaceae bacterium]